MDFVGIDHLEMYVGNVEEAAKPFCSGLGFRVTGRAGPETGQQGSRSLLLQQGHIRLVLTQALATQHEAADYVALHGDGIKDVALRVTDATAAFHDALRRGGQPVREPRVYEGSHGQLIHATVASPVGDVVHSFIQREAPESDFWPGRFQPVVSAAPENELMVTLDHVALCLMPGTLQATVDAYTRLLGLHQCHEENVETQYGGMNSKVVQDATGRVCFPMMVPMPGKLPGQIDRFLSNHRGPGVQHLAFLCDDILESAQGLRERQFPLLDSPAGYYEAMTARVGQLDEDIEVLRAGNVLVDREGEGYLLQVFTRSVHERRTLFFEIIQRKQARGFGAANVRALYQSVEQEMMRKEKEAARAALLKTGS
ncbi:4-hydroxyphenylpyruvate dioxygenase [Archangium lansingense]|uniref:4-hydroxyphenylpyruvate dioxygenase n=1 Tax=Archangium lansingense TaxID=2995310 RepID=A0ABT4ADW7_9BACT|nr:4-hydroxyphenylpyruvate dioxygenase [Archangium lansinium]MCY1079877.1 4-hydroxyphenylpyruvate dioxygenase [Archangium lansinium]